jgi:PleD family two-component response regulator
MTTYQQEQGMTPEIIFDRADKALYKAKQAGRDQVILIEIISLST